MNDDIREAEHPKTDPKKQPVIAENQALNRASERSFGKRTEDKKSKKRGWWAGLSAAQATVLCALIAAVPSILTWAATHFISPRITVIGNSVDNGLVQRLKDRLGSAAGFKVKIYESLFMGLRVPQAWSSDDAVAMFLSGGDVRLIKRYEESKAAIGLQFNLQPVQANYINDPSAQAKNQIDTIRTIDPTATVTDCTVDGKLGKSFEWVQDMSGRKGHLRLYLLRVTPTIELRFLAYGFKGAADEAEFWREIDQMMASVAIDTVSMNEKARKAGLPTF